MCTLVTKMKKKVIINIMNIITHTICTTNYDIIEQNQIPIPNPIIYKGHENAFSIEAEHFISPCSVSALYFQV